MPHKSSKLLAKLHEFECFRFMTEGVICLGRWVPVCTNAGQLYMFAWIVFYFILLMTNRVKHFFRVCGVIEFDESSTVHKFPSLVRCACKQPSRRAAVANSWQMRFPYTEGHGVRQFYESYTAYKCSLGLCRAFLKCKTVANIWQRRLQYTQICGVVYFISPLLSVKAAHAVCRVCMQPSWSATFANIWHMHSKCTHFCGICEFYEISTKYTIGSWVFCASTQPWLSAAVSNILAVAFSVFTGLWWFWIS